ncbi:MAG: methylated-DNA--[protein]-cysteine S-methyltransferase [Erysipelotrichaceae bacterium]
MLNHAFMNSLCGVLHIIANETYILSVLFEDEIGQENPNQITNQCVEQLNEYFLGIRKSFDLPLYFNQGTMFQQSVWHSLLDIPYGETCSYQDIADHIQHPRSERAVGMANHHNPFPIIIPCHRVILKSGKLGGYGGGIDKKIVLLELEKKFVD